MESQKNVSELLEQASVLESQQCETSIQKYETWGSRWFASLVAYFFLSKARREEWLGDLDEVHWEMLQRGYPRGLVNLVDIVRTCVLVVSVCRIKISDLFPVEKRD